MPSVLLSSALLLVGGLMPYHNARFIIRCHAIDRTSLLEDCGPTSVSSVRVHITSDVWRTLTSTVKIWVHHLWSVLLSYHLFSSGVHLWSCNARFIRVTIISHSF